MKGNCGVSYEKLKKYAKERMKTEIEDNSLMNLNTLLNDYLKISLSSKKEPILLEGPSSYKTFLSKLFLDNSKTINLNQESSIPQLLGNGAFFTDKEAKIFYLRLIINICKSNKYSDCLKKLNANNLKENEIDELIKESKDNPLKDIPKSFNYALKSLKDKLFSNKKLKDEDNLLSNMILEFQPGLFLSAILSGNTLILKNISNLLTVVLERFNELLSGNQNLTVNEDIYNTITENTNKEITGISKSFRIFGACPNGGSSKISEAAMNRFTLIKTSAYKLEEEKRVLNSYNNMKKLLISDKDISKLIEYKNRLLNTGDFGIQIFALKQMMNILDICSNIKEYYHLLDNNVDKEEILSKVFYYFCKGLIEKRNELIIKKLLAICELKEEPENKILDDNKNYKKPFIIAEEHGLKGIKSKISGLFLESKTPKDSEYNIAFTKKTIETLEILHFSLSNHFPIILEGLNGQGKQTCINYLADILDFQVENLIISPDKKVEDSLGHTIITKDKTGNLKIIFNETQLAKEIKYGNQGKKPTLFVIHNINNASPAILDLLNTIFDKDQESILFPDNSLVKKCNINIICIFNPIKGATRDNKLPQNLIFNSIYYIVQDPFLNDINEIIF